MLTSLSKHKSKLWSTWNLSPKELWTDICSDLLSLFSPFKKKYLPFETRVFEFTGKQTGPTSLTMEYRIEIYTHFGILKKNGLQETWGLGFIS